LAGYLALEGAEDELPGGGEGVDGVEAWVFAPPGRRVNECDIGGVGGIRAVCGAAWRVCLLPAQFTLLLAEGSDLYACHKREAALARLLSEGGSVSTAPDLRDYKRRESI